ncbi:MAG: ABC transporter permease subunit [Candidatus Altiarchaeales archaeon]|nr:ABC transporter permease subunit [Candidatus Altiarchaeales archaeon]MBD3417162.1 ABC transporter permease subunit [Candidatus Altiarchaeales archaeon]
MLPRFLVVSKYELKQYRGSAVDEAVILLVILAGFLMLITPEVGESSLPSSHNIYRVGYVEGSVFEGIEAYTLEFIPYNSKYEMISASSLDEIDAFAVYSKGRIVVFGSGTLKSDAALSHLNTVMTEFNTGLVYDYVEGNPSLSGVLLPLRLEIREEEIDYSSAINGSIELKRREVLKDIRMEDEPPKKDYTTANPQAEGRTSPSESAAPAEETPTNSGNRQATSSDSELLLPVDLTVEFPFKTLYKNMTLLSPLILMSILLALSLSKERVDRNIENLFDTPLTRAEILLGKAFPYMSVMVALSLAYGMQASLSFDALKVAMVFSTLSVTMLSFGIFSTIVSRSYRELTFIGSFSLFAFFFFIVLPNVFSGVNVLAFISPLDTVTSIENGASIPLTDVILSLLPYVFLSMFFLSFTGVCFNAEVVFSSHSFRRLLEVFYKDLTVTLKNKIIYAFVSVALLVPFIFIVESIFAYLVLPLGHLSPFASLIVLAMLEEIVKITPYLYRRMNPALYGVVAGLSFFLMEKLFNLYLIVKVYTFLGGPYVFFFQKLMPTLLVHMLTTSVFAFVIYTRRGRISYAVGLTLSMVIHFAYNYLLISGVL